LDFKTYLPGDILTKVDRASMANSLEVRTPFLDYELVEWVAGLPTELKLRGGVGKYVLKESLRPLLPEEILFRKKMGFAVPLDLWFRDSLSQRIGDALRAQHVADSGIFNMSYLSQMVGEHSSGRRDHSASLWALLMFEGFMRHQLDGGIARRSSAVNF
jgi:asparagine synthase (glutamine-hydrolysing)